MISLIEPRSDPRRAGGRRLLSRHSDSIETYGIVELRTSVTLRGSCYKYGTVIRDSWYLWNEHTYMYLLCAEGAGFIVDSDKR